jgi:hypothetical protein
MGGHGRSKYPAGVVGAKRGFKRGRQARIAFTQQAAQTNPCGVHEFGQCWLGWSVAEFSSPVFDVKHPCTIYQKYSARASRVKRFEFFFMLSISAFPVSILLTEYSFEGIFIV